MARRIRYLFGVVLALCLCLAALTVSYASPPTERGDLNLDGVVNRDDALYLLRHVLTPDIYPINQSGDFDSDGDVDVDDALYLMNGVDDPDNYPVDCIEHIPVKTDPISPTCDMPGLSEGEICSMCKVVLSSPEALPATGHTLEKGVVTAASCTEYGYTSSYCTVCGATFETDINAPTGHTFGEYYTVTEADCEHDGLEERACSDCGETEERTILSAGHNYVIDCLDSGVGVLRCSVCGNILEEDAADSEMDTDKIFRGCEDNFAFVVKSPEGGSYVKDRLSFTNDIYGTPSADTAEHFPDVTVSDLGEGRYQVSPTGKWAAGTVYTVKADGNITFELTGTDELNFKIKNSGVVDMGNSDHVIFVPFPREESLPRDGYEMVFVEETGILVLTFPDEDIFDSSHIGSIICAGEYSSMDELISDPSRECNFGKNRIRTAYQR